MKKPKPHKEAEMPSTKTTIRLDDYLIERIKIHAIRKRTTLQALATRALAELLEREEEKSR